MSDPTTVVSAEVVEVPQLCETAVPTTFPDGIPIPPEVLANKGDCVTHGQHQHQWIRLTDRGTFEHTTVPVGPSGVVILTEEVVAQLLAAAGWELDQ